MHCLNVTKILKRSLYASVFVSLVGCQPDESNTTKTDTSTPSSVMASDNDSAVPPLLTLDELLNASDFQEGIKQSVLNDDISALKDWQDQLLAVAKEVNLAPIDVKRISGQQGLVFIEFEAKKQLFNDEFIELFMNFESIDDLIQKYPYLTGVHKRARSLVDARDLAIERAATLLAEEGMSGDATQQARAQWQDYMINSGRLETLRN
jgi:hypothetical protein